MLFAGCGVIMSWTDNNKLCQFLTRCVFTLQPKLLITQPRHIASVTNVQNSYDGHCKCAGGGSMFM